MKEASPAGHVEKTASPIQAVRRWLLPAVASLGLLLCLHAFGLTATLDRAVYDFLQQTQANPASINPDAVLMLIDETSLKEMSQRNMRWPWPRDCFAALMVALQKGGAKEILVDLVFTEHSEDEWKDFILRSYAAACPSVILTELETVPQILWDNDFKKQYPNLELSKRVAFVRHQPDSDGVLRWYDYNRSLAASGASFPENGLHLIRWPSSLSAFRKAYPQRVLVASAWIEVGEKIMKAAEAKLGENVTDPVQLAAILRELPAPAGVEAVKGKTVFIGVNAAAAYDVKTTPLSATEPGVMYHLAAWSNAQNQNWISVFKIPVLPIALLLCAVVLFMGIHEKVQIPPLILIGVILLLLVAGSSWVLFYNDLWFPPSDLALGILLGFGTAAVHNWREEKQRKRQVKALFGSYVSEKVLDTLLKDPEAVKLGGERKELTIYFSDLAGFTDMSEGMKPEDLLEVVNIYLDEMSPFILDNGGYLDKYIGDAIMGVFGAPEVLENHAISACKAALESRDHLLKVSARMEAERGVKLHARIGINTGDIIVGNVGSKKKLNYTVVGDAVNLASRLEGANKEFGTTIMLGENTAAMLDGRFAIRPLELIRVKGKKKPVQTFELYGWTEKLSPAQKDLLVHFREGYTAYQRRDFAAAFDKFNIACKIDNVDNLSLKYSERCAEYLLQPPPPEWDGVFVMTKK